MNTAEQAHVGPLADMWQNGRVLGPSTLGRKESGPGGYPARGKATPVLTQLHLPPLDTDAGRPADRGRTHGRSYKTATAT